ncbi:sulfurtransferase complex subunit TusC [Candidatus Palibaumannia cicadellinicola]|uniref:tRNA 5-methylaminomethyl-2-thiouridine synthase TusC n=1 Tax=Candidatus Palibaumannia cicadellinicola TaxID=186490 RepID=A0A088NBA8_9GAMM|nr:sulfurtransferase complex subunit TusC [Candidatus Baumannia cicadellinicola]AIN47408.1 tRNA 5-methylaminomethyl-2-thiouridine synthase TusC [Candidatus Baumannia cicadellinicola]
MKNIACIFTHGPHGNTTGREGLDALLAISAFCELLGVFFIGDGVLLLLTNQQPEQILMKNFVPLFNILPLYDINRLYLYADSAIERGFDINVDLILDVEWLPADIWNKNLYSYDHIITF